MRNSLEDVYDKAIGTIKSPYRLENKHEKKKNNKPIGIMRGVFDLHKFAYRHLAYKISF